MFKILKCKQKISILQKSILRICSLIRDVQRSAMIMDDVACIITLTKEQLLARQYLNFHLLSLEYIGKYVGNPERKYLKLLELLESFETKNLSTKESIKLYEEFKDIFPDSFFPEIRGEYCTSRMK